MIDFLNFWSPRSGAEMPYNNVSVGAGGVSAAGHRFLHVQVDLGGFRLRARWC